MKLKKLIYVLILVVVFVSCENDDNKVDLSDISIVGYAQKGQLIKGASITAYALNDKLTPTGESFPSIIKDDLGSFGISAEVSAPYLELKAEGYYFVENTGETSQAPIYLNALVSSSQKEVNINLLTTITSGRIKKLMNEGKPFGVAKVQAEKEAIDVFSMQSQNIEIGFEKMNISKDGNANAILLAASCLIQEGRSAGEIQHIISDISSEFETAGTLPDELIIEVFNQSKKISIPNIVENLMTFYQSKGLTDYKIPSFYAILNDEYSHGFHIINSPYVFVESIYNMEVNGGTKEYLAVSYEDFVTESNVDWITAEIIEICSNLYTLKINVAPNSEVYARTGYLQVKSRNGEILYSNKTIQRGNAQRIYIELKENTTRTRVIQEGDVVNINGNDYNLAFDGGEYLRGKYYVDLPKSDKGYGISNMPEMVTAGKNGDVLCATFTYNSEVNEFIHDDNEVTGGTRNANYNTTIEGTQTSKIPCYAALKGTNDYELPNPAQVTLESVCALLTLQFKHKTLSSELTFAKLEVEFSNDGFLAGETTTCMYPDQVMFDPSYKVPETEYKNKSNKVIVNNINNDNKVSILVHPQKIKKIKCVAYDESNSPLFQIEENINFELQKGTNLSLAFDITD